MNIKDALEIILEKSLALSHEKIPLDKAIGRVLSEDVFAIRDDPPFTRSAMDGWAISTLDENTFIKGEIVKAGDKNIPLLMADTAIKVMTGAPIPERTMAVVKVEDVKEDENKIILKINPNPNSNIREKGEYLHAGEVVASRGDMVTPILSSILYGAGISEVLVARMPRVSVLSTGNELVTLGEKLDYGQIINSNGPMLTSLCKRWGSDVYDLGICPDDIDKLQNRLSGITEYDISLICGGASVGDFDYVPRVLKELGAEIFFSRVSVKPGKHLLFAKIDKSLVFALPGNPVSTLTSAYIFVQASIRNMIGLKPALPIERAIIKGETPIPKERDMLEPAHFIATPEGNFINHIPNGGSADLFSWSSADAIMILYCSGLQKEETTGFIRL